MGNEEQPRVPAGSPDGGEWTSAGIAGPAHWKTQQVASLHGGFHLVPVHVAPQLTERGTVHSYKVKYRRQDDPSGAWHDDMRKAVSATEK